MKLCPQCRHTYHDTNSFCPRDGAVLSIVDRLEPGTIFRHKFEIQEEIGRGGMGVVYRVRHMRLQYDRALKLINARYSGDSQAARRFVSEAILANQIDHPNVVRVHDVDETEDGYPYIIMEYVAGKSLRQILHPETGPAVVLEPLRAIRIASQVCAALAAAHAHNIVHRDVKPDNILLVTQSDGSDLVKVVDFGLGKAIRALEETPAGESPTVSQNTAFVGTPQYCSPEQIMGSDYHELDHRTDIYSLGIVLYEMLVGQPPFTGPIKSIMEQQVVAVPAFEKSGSDSRIPQKLIDATLKALSKDPESRFSSAEAMALALEEAEAGVSGNVPLKAAPSANAAVPDTYRPVREVPFSRFSPSRLAFLAGIVVGAALIIAIALAVIATRPVLSRPPALAAQSDSAFLRAAGDLGGAKEAFERGAYDDAIRLYRGVLARDSGNEEALNGLAGAQTAKATEEQVFGRTNR